MSKKLNDELKPIAEKQGLTLKEAKEQLVEGWQMPMMTTSSGLSMRGTHE